MRNLSSTLLSAQRAASHIPYVNLEATNKMTGVTRLKWERLYEGDESEYHHGLSIPSDGSLIRVRITPPSDGRKLYWQRVVNPGYQSDFSNWNYTGNYNCRAVTVVSYSTEVSIFWINASQELWQIKSTNCGVNWANPELLDYSPSTDVNGITAAYKSNGDIALFFTDQAILYIKKRMGGSWQAKSAWNKTTGELSSVSAVYQVDWNLLITGQDTSGNYKVWSLTYGDGGDVPVGLWSDIREIASAPSGGDYEFCAVFLDKPDVYRAFYLEKFNGVENYARPMGTHSIPDTDFINNLWREPIPFNLSCDYGVALAHHDDYCWLSTANGVWRAGLSTESLNLSEDILSLKYTTSEENSHLIIELRNDDGKYQSPAEGDLTVLNFGSQIEFSPGYCTSQGNETSPGPSFWLNGWEYVNSACKSKFILYAVDGWSLLKDWRARHQFRWNRDYDEMTVKQILETVLARVGLKLEVKSQSSVITGFYPDFTIHPGDNGVMILRHLLSFVPDLLFIEGVKAYLVYPQSTDNSEYSYGQTHTILQGRYRIDSWQTNQINIEGLDSLSQQSIIVNSFSWEQMERFYDRTKQIEDRNITTVSEGQALAASRLRKIEIDSLKDIIFVPVNCGQQLFDVIDITDDRSGLLSAKRRVKYIIINYVPERGVYEEKITLGGV